MPELTPAQAAKAVLLATDFLYYSPRILKIKTKAGKIEPFILNRAQLLLHKIVEEQRQRTGKVRVIILKGRQQGISTYIEARLYWKTSTKKGKRAYILTHEQPATDNLFGMTKRYHDNSPEALQPSTKNNSAKALTFDKMDSEFSVATAGSKDTGRSGTGQYFHGSEVAFWNNANDHMAGIGQTIPEADDTEIFLESTGNGVGNLFHGMWQDAIKGKSDYIAVFIPWFWQPEYAIEPPPEWQPDAEGLEYIELYEISMAQAYWRDRKIKNDFRGDSNFFDQEYPATSELAFRRQSVESLIKLEWVERAMKRAEREPMEPLGAKIMGIDPAEYGQDDTIFIMRQGRCVTHLQRHHKKGPMEVVALAAFAIDEWEPDYINVDAGGLGSGIADRLIELGYPVTRILFGESAYKEELYVIRKDEMAGEMKEWFEDQPNQIIPDDALKSELCQPGYTHDSARRVKVETKEHMKNVRGLGSPDGFDGLSLTFAIPIHTHKTKPSRGLRPHNWRVGA